MNAFMARYLMVILMLGVFIAAPGFVLAGGSNHEVTVSVNVKADLEAWIGKAEGQVVKIRLDRGSDPGSDGTGTFWGGGNSGPAFLERTYEMNWLGVGWSKFHKTFTQRWQVPWTELSRKTATCTIWYDKFRYDLRPSRTMRLTATGTMTDGFNCNVILP